MPTDTTTPTSSPNATSSVNKKLTELFLVLIMAAQMILLTAFVLILIFPLTFSIGFIYLLVAVLARNSFSPNAVEDLALKKIKGIGFFAKFATRYRTPLVIAFVLPMSLIFDAFFYFRQKFIEKVHGNTPEMHDFRVEKIKSEIKMWDGKRKMATARPNWLMMTPKLNEYKNSSHLVEIPLYDILEIDEQNMTVRCEPGVSMGQLSRFLKQQNLTIPVLPEMDDLTVGGLICGCGVESSSHIYGLFQAICVQYELVNFRGELIVANEKNENSDYFDAIPWSYGSLGFLVAATIRVIPAKKYVKLEYHAFTEMNGGVEAYCDLFKEASEDNSDPSKNLENIEHTLIEGLVYSRNSAVVMLGSMVNEVDEEVGDFNAIGKWYKPWFFKHVESFLTGEKDRRTENIENITNKESLKKIEFMPLRDYYHRHTKSIFWELQDIIPVGNNPVFRFLFGWMLPPKVGFLKLTQGETIRKMYEQQHVIQDMLVPMSRLKDSIDFFEENYSLYPLWLCPMKLFGKKAGFLNLETILKKQKLKGIERCGEVRNPGLLSSGTKEDVMYVDVGAYGVPAACRKGEDFDADKIGRKVEDFVLENGGFQMLYADSYLNRDDFRKMFDHELLDKLRSGENRGAATAFPEVISF